MNGNLRQPPLWRFIIFLFHTLGLPFQLFPIRVPRESQNLYQAAADHDAVIVFNGGGFGDFPLEKVADFASVLEGVRDTVRHLGFRPITIIYRRVPPGLAGKISGTKEQLNSFRLTSQFQINDLGTLCRTFSQKKFILLGFSIGGALSAKTLAALEGIPNLYGITIGVPFWFQTFASAQSLVLNNDNLDPICTGNLRIIAINVVKSPGVWLKSRLTGKRISLALSFKFPFHDYPWSSPRIGIPIRHFLENHLGRSNSPPDAP